MSISAVTSLMSSHAIYQQVAGRQATSKSKAAASEKGATTSNDALRAARQASAGAGSSHSEKTEVRLRAYA